MTDAGVVLDAMTAAAGPMTAVPLPQFQPGQEFDLWRLFLESFRAGDYRVACGVALTLVIGLLSRYWSVIPWHRIWDPLSDEQRTWFVLGLAALLSLPPGLLSGAPSETILENAWVAGASAVAAWRAGGGRAIKAAGAWRARRLAKKRARKESKT